MPLFKYLGYKILNNDMNMDFEENLAKHNKLNGCRPIKRNFGRNMRTEVK
jgi:hypothetical protein